MVVKHSPTGLIATTRTEATPPLHELVSCCGWPLLLGATPRRLQRELSLHNPDCMMLWLDDWQEVNPTAQLIAWTRQRGARPYRVVVAYRMESNVESVFRAAGAHGFLPLAGQSASFVADALWPLLQHSTPFEAASAADQSPLLKETDRVSSQELTSDLVRPP